MVKVKGYEKHAWILLFSYGTLVLLEAITHILGQGIGDVDLGTASAALANFVRLDDRLLGIAEAGFSILIMAISAKSYRRGERWAWYTLLVVPIFLLALPLNNPRGGLALAYALTAPLQLVALLGLFLPFRKFFPKKRPIAP